MQRTKISLACGFAIAALAQQANATPISAAIEVWVSGASAQRALLGAAAEQIFGGKQTTVVAGVTTVGTTAPMAIYLDNGATPGNNYRSYYGTFVTVAGGVTLATAVSGKTGIIGKSDVGGSITGVNNVALGTLTTFMRPDNATATCSALPSFKLGTNVYTTSVFACPTSTFISVAPDAGLSDVEPALLNLPINLPDPSSANTLTPAQVAKLSSTPEIGQVFGVAGNAAYRTYTTDISSSIYRTVITAEGASATGNDWNYINPKITLAGTPVVLCRRQPGSGSQASSNLYFTHNPGGPTTLTPLRTSDSNWTGVSFNPAPAGSVSFATGTTAPAATATVALNAPGAGAGLFVFEGSSGGAVTSCLNTADAGGVLTAVWPDPSTPTKSYTIKVSLPAKSVAVGVLSEDTGAAATETWAFLTLDTVAPSTANVASGAYHDWYEAYVNYNFTALAARPLGTQDVVFFLRDHYGDFPLEGTIDIPVIDPTTGLCAPGVNGVTVNPYARTQVPGGKGNQNQDIKICQ